MKEDNIDIIIEEDEEDSSYIFDISTEGKTPNIKSLRLDWEDKTLQIPKYQRNFVWTIKQASLFIESLMLKLPIPTLMFIADETNNIIIDGQQRIKSILYFIGAIKPDEISEKEQKFINFKLQGLPKDSPWENKAFSDFTPKDKKQLLDTDLNITYITLKNPEDPRAIFYIFERLNKNGTILTPQEIRNCIYSGSFNDFITKMNDYPNWRKFLTNDSDTYRQKDVELILRFFALYDNLDNYKKGMKDFLSEYMSKPNIRNMSNNQINQKKILFESTVDAILSYLGEKPFHIKNGLNSAVLDSVMIAFARNLKHIPNNILKKYQELYKNSEYYNYCSKSVNDVASVKSRIQMADEYLFGKVYDINLKIIRLYEFPVSAGVGNFINDENIPCTKIYTSERRADFAIKISGDSMEPDIYNGDILLIKKQEKVNNGQIGIFVYDSELLCKKLYKNKKRISLISLNKKYNPIDISSNRRFDVIGMVLGKHEPFLNMDE